MKPVSSENNLLNSRPFFLILTLAAGLIILAPHADYIRFLAQGDHGRDLYSFKKTFEGALPYKDYFTQNGPLMPYYYSLIYLVKGVSIQSTLLGYNLLILLAGVFLFLACSTFLLPFPSFLCALWYWSFRGDEFFYTFNHVGVFVFMLASLTFLFRYIKNPLRSLALGGGLLLIPAMLIRPNIGAACLAAFLISLVCADRKLNPSSQKKNALLYLLGASILAFAVFILYFILVKVSPQAALTHDLAYYWKAIHPEKIGHNFILACRIAFSFVSLTWTQRFVSLLFFIFAVRGVAVWRTNLISREEKAAFSLVFLSLGLFLAFVSLEFFLGTIWFRWIWTLPLIILILFFVLELGLKQTSAWIRHAVHVLLLVVCFVALRNQALETASHKNLYNRLMVGANDIYVSSDQGPQWTFPVMLAGDFIQKNTSPDEKIVTLPYDPLYYFLSGRDSARRELSFWGINADRDEPHLIREIEEKNVNLILISNRAFRCADPRFGQMGKRYGKKFLKYLDENFEAAATFGPWDAPAYWVRNHAVRIYLRK